MDAGDVTHTTSHQYITVLSNSSKEIYPSNNPQHFINHLSREYSLSPNTEIALSELYIPVGFSNVTKWDDYEIIFFRAAGNREYAIRLDAGYYSGLGEVVKALNGSLKARGLGAKVRMTYTPGSKRVSIAFDETLSFVIPVESLKLARILGFRAGKIYTSSLDPKFVRRAMKHRRLEKEKTRAFMAAPEAVVYHSDPYPEPDEAKEDYPPVVLVKDPESRLEYYLEKKPREKRFHVIDDFGYKVNLYQQQEEEEEEEEDAPPPPPPIKAIEEYVRDKKMELPIYDLDPYPKMQLNQLRKGGYPPVVRVRDRKGVVHELKKNPAGHEFETLNRVTLKKRNDFVLQQYEDLIEKMAGPVHDADPYPKMQLSQLRRYPPVVRVRDKNGKVHELKKNPAEHVFEVLDLATMETRNAFVLRDYEELLNKMNVRDVDPYPTMELSQLIKGYPPAVYVRDGKGKVHALRKSPAERVFEVLDLETFEKRNVFSANDYSNLRKQYEQQLLQQQQPQGDDPAVRFVKSEEEEAALLLLSTDDEEYAYEVHTTPFLFYEQRRQDDDDDDEGYDDGDDDDDDVEHAHAARRRRR
jgi:hypothetical protein